MNKTLVAAKKFAEENIIGADLISISHKRNTLVLKRSYFYTNGMTSQKFAVQMLMGMNNIDTPFFDKCKIVHDEQTWAGWPKSSYFICELQISE